MKVKIDKTNLKNQINIAVLFFLIMPAINALATNGDSLEGIGAVSGAMGGTGVAAPQDGLSAIVNNPAALPFVPGAENPEVKLGTTFFKPQVNAKITTPAGTYSGSSDDPISYIPYFSYTQPINERWFIGFAAYGISGMGVDYHYKKWDLDGDPKNGYEGSVYTKFASMKMAPALSYKISDSLAVGGAFHLNYSTLDIGQGKSEDVNAGFSIGAVQRLGDWRIGASYTSPQSARFKKVYNFDAFMGDTKPDDLKLEQPEVYHAGIAWEPNSKWTLEGNIKKYMWAKTDGYGDFDWRNQWVYAFGAQYKVNSALSLRAGFNYGKNPVREHHGWDPSGITKVQGKSVPTMGYELLRNVAFPAIVESHITFGASYQINENLAIDLAYMHAFDKTIHSRSQGNAIQLESSLYENSLSLGLVWTFR